MKKITLGLLLALASLSAAHAASLTSSLTPKATEAECNRAWQASNAYETCDGVVSPSADDHCSIAATCLNNAGWYKQTFINARYTDVSRLNNCNATLTVGSC